MLDQHELSIAKILLDSPELYDRAQGLGLSSAKAGNHLLKNVLATAEGLREKKIPLNRDALLAFMEFLSPDERQHSVAMLNEADISGGSAEALDAHARESLSAWRARATRLALSEAVAALNDTGDADKAISIMKERSEEVLSGAAVSGSAADVAEEHHKYLEGLPEGDPEPDQLFGLPSLDAVRGADPGTGELIFIAARAKGGKSSLFNNILRQSVRLSRPTAFVSAEMSARKSYERLLAGHVGFSTRLAGSRPILTEKSLRELYLAAKSEIAASPLYIEQKGLTVPAIRQWVYSHYYRNDVRLFLIDRVGLFQEASGKDEFSGRRHVTAQLRALVNELPGLKIIVASQLTNSNAKAKTSRPHFSDLFGGTGGQADLTQLFMLDRPAHSRPDQEEFQSGPWAGTPSQIPGTPYSYAEVFCPLSSNGPANGSARLIFDASKQIFENLNEMVQFAVQPDWEEEAKRILAGENTFSLSQAAPPPPKPSKEPLKTKTSNDDLPF